MEKSRKTNKLVIILLLVLLAGLSIGFAAFDSTLTIKSGAVVTPSADDFQVGFSSKIDESKTGDIETDGTYAQAATVNAGSLTVEDLTANFTEPGQTATWAFYAYNGGHYDAFLNDVTIGAIECTAREGTDQTKVDAAKQGISVKVSVGGTEFTATDLAVNNHKLEKTTGEKIIVTLTYSASSALADGIFDVTVGDIVLGYDSIDSGITAD